MNRMLQSYAGIVILWRRVMISSRPLVINVHDKAVFIYAWLAQSVERETLSFKKIDNLKAAGKKRKQKVLVEPD